jgi:small subunit ribosomal protein S16
MVRLRLKRMGKINSPFYRIVAVDQRRKRDGAYIEALGHYNPTTEPSEIKVDIENSIKWLNKGAQPTDTVKSLFKKAGVMERWHNEKLEAKKEAATEKSE